MLCNLCKTTPKNWTGNDRKCGFPQGIFDGDNWNCATLNKLRDIVDEINEITHTNDENAAIIPFMGEFIVISWYKRRGCTSTATYINIDDQVSPLPLLVAEECIRRYEQYGIKALYYD